MKRVSSILWGIVIIAVGVLIALRACNILDFEIFFDGWWTLFIIIPCLTGLITEREKTGNIIGLLIGVFLLLCCQDVLSFGMLWKLLLPTILVIIGLRILLGGLIGNRAGEILMKLRQDGDAPKACTAVFSSQKIHYDGQVFEGAEITAVFGGVECDLRRAVIERDCALQITSVFGGVTVLVPNTVNVKISSNSVFGGISGNPVPCADAPTLYITGSCVFGGADIK